MMRVWAAAGCVGEKYMQTDDASAAEDEWEEEQVYVMADLVDLVGSDILSNAQRVTIKDVCGPTLSLEVEVSDRVTRIFTGTIEDTIGSTIIMADNRPEAEAASLVCASSQVVQFRESSFRSSASLYPTPLVADPAPNHEPARPSSSSSTRPPAAPRPTPPLPLLVPHPPPPPPPVATPPPPMPQPPEPQPMNQVQEDEGKEEAKSSGRSATPQQIVEI